MPKSFFYSDLLNDHESKFTCSCNAIFLTTCLFLKSPYREIHQTLLQQPASYHQGQVQARQGSRKLHTIFQGMLIIHNRIFLTSSDLRKSSMNVKLKDQLTQFKF